MIVTNNIEIVWIIDSIDGYGFGKDKQLYNLKSGRRKKHTMVNHTKGWWVGKKFYTHNKLKPLLIKIQKEHCPF